MRCAVPVRGDTYGEECLDDILALGHAPSIPPARWRWPAVSATGIGFAIAVLASLLPWQRFGQGAGLFGAYGLTPRYSLFGALISLVGLALWASVSVGSLRPGRWWAPALRVCAALVIVAAALHVLRPPSIGPASFGPWVSLVGGIVAFVGTFMTPDRVD